jgi:hypothetical protein
MDEGLILLLSACSPELGRRQKYLCMSALNYQVEPLVNCPDINFNDAVFILVTTMIEGCDAIEEFLAYGLYPLSAGFGFGLVSDGTTAVPKVVVPLPVFPMTHVAAESASHFLVKVEMDAERIIGSYGPKGHEACIHVKLPNGGRLN